MNNNNRQYCLNCNTPFPAEVKDDHEAFCPSCGQSNKANRLSFWEIVSSTFSSIFNLDGRLFHTIRDIYKPHALTRAYVEGRRKQYVNPGRLFIFLLVSMITIILILSDVQDNTMGMDVLVSRAEKTKLLEDFDTTVDTLDLQDTTDINLLRSSLFKKIIKDSSNYISTPDSLFDIDVEKYKIPNYEVYHLSTDEIIEKYNVEGWQNKLYVSQYTRLMNNPSGILNYVIKNNIWTLILTVFLASIFLFLLYYRKNYYLVEHLVLLLNGHSFLFLVLILMIVVEIKLPENTFFNILSFLLFIVIIGVQYISIKRYYNHGKFKAFLVWNLFNFVYVIIFSFMALIVGFISLILF